MFDRALPHDYEFLVLSVLERTRTARKGGGYIAFAAAESSADTNQSIAVRKSASAFTEEYISLENEATANT